MGTYTGDVSPGDAAQTRDLGCLTLTKVAVDPTMSNNSYLLRCARTGDQVGAHSVYGVPPGCAFSGVF